MARTVMRFPLTTPSRCQAQSEEAKSDDVNELDMSETFDFIVVGGGSAGVAIAARPRKTHPTVRRSSRSPSGRRRWS
jgi:hypothetical protein